MSTTTEASTETFSHVVTAEKARPFFSFEDFALMHEMLRLGGDASPADAEFRLTFAPNFSSKSFAIDDARSAFDWMVKNRASVVCYINLAHRRKGAPARGPLADCYPTSLLCMDFDADGGVHKSKRLASWEYIRAVLAEFPFPLAMTVNTGGGLHAYVRLNRSAVDDAADAELRALFAEYFGQRFARDGFDGADAVSKNRAHLMRAAGSIAAKPQSEDPYLPVRVEQHDLEATVDADELKAWLVANTPARAVKVAKERAVRKTSTVAFDGDDPADMRPGTVLSRKFPLHEILLELHEIEVVTHTDEQIEMVWEDEQRAESERTLITAEKSAGGLWRTWTWGEGTAKELGLLGPPTPTTTLAWIAQMLDDDHQLTAQLAKHILKGTMGDLLNVIDDRLTPEAARALVDAARTTPVPSPVVVSVGECNPEERTDLLDSEYADLAGSFGDDPSAEAPILTIPDSLPHDLHTAVEALSDFERKVCGGRFQVRIRHGRGETFRVRQGKDDQPDTLAAFIDFIAYRSRHIVTLGSGARVTHYVVSILTMDGRKFHSEPLTTAEIQDVRAIAAKTAAPIAWPLKEGADFVNMLATAYEPVPEFSYEHTGHIVHEGVEMFITPAGAMTADGPLAYPASAAPPGLSEDDLLSRPSLMGVDLTVLPVDVREATKSITEMLALAPKRPEIFWLPICLAVATLIPSPSRATIGYIGQTESAKSMAATFCQSLYVPGPRTELFPVNILADTLAPTTVKAGYMRHLMLVADDYKTVPDRMRNATSTSIVEYLSTAAIGAQRDRADGSRKLAANAPMASSVLITAEKVPDGASTANRIVKIRVHADDFALNPAPGEIVSPVDDWTDRHGRTNYPSQVMASLVQYVLRRSREVGGMKSLESWARTRRSELATKIAPRSRAVNLVGFIALGAVIIREWSVENGVQDLLPTPGQTMAMLRAVVEENERSAVQFSVAERFIAAVSGQMDTRRSYLLGHDRELPKDGGPEILVASGFQRDASYAASAIGGPRKVAGWWSHDYRFVALSRTWILELAASIPELAEIGSTELIERLRGAADGDMTGKPDKKGVTRTSAKLKIAGRPAGALVFTPQALGLLVNAGFKDCQYCQCKTLPLAP